jgi:sugar phosphate isomerase/epimerase
MIYMHTYTFRDYPVERALRKAKQYGFDGVELSPCHWGWSHEAMQARFDEIFAAAEKIGIPIMAVDFGGDFLSPDPSVRQRAVDGLKALLPRVKALGVGIVNGGCGTVVGPDPSDWNANGSAAAAEEHWQRAAETFKQVAEVAEQTGVLVTFEIHMNALHDTAASTIRLLESIGSSKIKAALDAGNMLPLKRAEAADQAVRLLGTKHLGYMHLKNCRIFPGGVADYNVSLDGGHIDMFKVALALKEIGYAGDYCIEYCGIGDASPKAEGDIRYWKSLLAEAGF